MLRLIAEGETDITTIVASLEVGQSALSQHLTKLRAMKLVKTSRAPACLVFCYARVEADRRRLERITLTVASVVTFEKASRVVSEGLIFTASERRVKFDLQPDSVFLICRYREKTQLS